MDNIRSSIDLLFSRADAQHVLDGYFSCDTAISPFDRKRFISAHQVDYPQRYTDDQIGNIYDMVDHTWCDNPLEREGRGTWGGETCCEDRHPLYILSKFADDVLLEVSEEPVCDFSQLLRWREISLKLGEDCFTTAFLAHRDIIAHRQRNHFTWGISIGNNNTSLQALFREERLSDLHYHLQGSTAVFDLNWLSLMNSIHNQAENFRKINNSLSPDLLFHHDDQVLSLYSLMIKASFIRSYLFGLFQSQNYSEYFSWDVGSGASREFDCRSGDGYGLWSNYFIRHFLAEKDEGVLRLHLRDLQSKIDGLKYTDGHHYDGTRVIDYAIPHNLPERDNEYLAMTYIYGERKWLYDCFKYIFSQKENYVFIRDLLYVYLLAKVRLRKEIIQVNDRVGFYNFKLYQDRKECFIAEGSIYQELISHLAIRSSQMSGNVDYIEARIQPKESVHDLTHVINSLDRCITHRAFFPETRYRISRFKFQDEFSHHYLYHFIKGPDDSSESPFGYITHYRHSKLRQKVKNQALAINNLRRSTHREQSRVVGIDAASSEIGCRPEVFATAFRFLKYYSYNSRYQYFFRESIDPLGMTYHVGEDFLDMVDGLRAVDEAILFLNLSDGARIGHGLVLGTNASDYYEKRNRKIILPRHDFLDNVAWMIAILPQTGEVYSSQLDNQLRDWFRDCYYRVYGEDGMGEVCPHDYYNAWKLRGDDPHHYRNINLVELRGATVACFAPLYLNFWDRAGVNNFDPGNSILRTNKHVELYYRYHFDETVKRKGRENIEIEVSLEYMRGVEILQSFMCRKVADKHITIEVNPTSNQLIGEYKRYDMHPMIQLYNIGLTHSHEELAGSPQIHITIGTDDQGVFSTNLETEYALMALSLEKCCNERDEFRYNHTHICDWLRRIAQMGNEHRFKQNRREAWSD